MQQQDHDQYTWTKEHLFSILTTGKHPILTDGPLKLAFQTIDRQDFVPEHIHNQAYADEELEVAQGQTINSPVLVAQMLTALNLSPGQKVLELGTGSGYSLALIAMAITETGFVYSMERNLQLVNIARNNLKKYSQLKNYELVFSDGAAGLPARAPYDAIHVSFAYPEVPQSLLTQLKVGGTLVSPLTNMEIKLYKRISASEIDVSLLTVKHFAKFQPGVE